MIVNAFFETYSKVTCIIEEQNWFEDIHLFFPLRYYIPVIDGFASVIERLRMIQRISTANKSPVFKAAIVIFTHATNS